MFCLALYKEQIGILAHTTLEISHLMCAKRPWRPWSSASLDSLLIWFSWWASLLSLQFRYKHWTRYYQNKVIHYDWQNYFTVMGWDVQLIVSFLFATAVQINDCLKQLRIQTTNGIWKFFQIALAERLVQVWENFLVV